MPERRARTVVLDGSTLTIDDIALIAREPSVRLELDPDALARVAAGRRRLELQLAAAERRGAAAGRIYGVTTGFGEFKDIPIAADERRLLQHNLLRSHAVGTGDNADPNDAANYFPAEVVRATLALRANAFLKGFSGVRPILVHTIVAMLDAGVVPLVPTRGSVGSSGDLCPLAHLFMSLLGEGEFYVVRDAGALGPKPARTAGGRLLCGRPVLVRPASKLGSVLGPALSKRLGRRSRPAIPDVKEGLALTNGATVSAALLALAVHDAERLQDTADITAAMTLEAIGGHTRALDPRVHAARGIAGQCDAAAHLRRLLDGSRLADRAASPQDPYSVRCTPQVHGASREAIAFARRLATAEINAATDNPLFFDGDPPCDTVSRLARGDDPASLGDQTAFSAGNFHGQPVGVAADVLAIGVAEIANISERRAQMLLDRHQNRGLPAHLTAAPGTNSGLMIAQYGAAGLVSENKTLCHPASVDSIPTSANSEDHVAMATWAARKATSVVRNAEAVVAVECLVAAQALDWRAGVGVDPNGTTTTTNADPKTTAERRLRAIREIAKSRPHPRVTAALGRGTGAAYAAVRKEIATLAEDRVLEADLRAARRLVGTGALRAAAAAAVAVDADLPPKTRHPNAGPPLRQGRRPRQSRRKQPPRKT